jgi:hypothetical protein
MQKTVIGRPFLNPKTLWQTAGCRTAGDEIEFFSDNSLLHTPSLASGRKAPRLFFVLSCNILCHLHKKLPDLPGRKTGRDRPLESWK